jgi:hypothetical protein
MRYIIDLFKFKRFRGGRKTDLFKRSAFYLELKKTNAFGQGIEVYGTLNRKRMLGCLTIVLSVIKGLYVKD